jgi:hypothetical protein
METDVFSWLSDASQKNRLTISEASSLKHFRLEFVRSIDLLITQYNIGLTADRFCFKALLKKKRFTKIMKCLQDESKCVLLVGTPL